CGGFYQWMNPRSIPSSQPLRRALHQQRARPPRAMEGGPVNHSLFNSTLTVPALRVPKRQCADLMKQLRGYTLERPKIRCVVGDGQQLDTRLLLLEPYAGDVGLPEPVQQAASKHGLALTSYDLPLSYEQHNVDQVLKKLLPAGVDAPASFETVGHIIHLNLREEQLPYRYLIGQVCRPLHCGGSHCAAAAALQVLLDKNPHIRTVVNKAGAGSMLPGQRRRACLPVPRQAMAVQVGAIDNEFRVFSMELLAGQPGTETEVVQHGMRFRLDFAQVYWNSRLEAEHQRLVARHFRPGQVVVDVMAGVGPFAVPAAQAGCMVYANDLNPSSARYMAANARLNHLSGSIHVFNMDGRDFVRLLCSTPGGSADDLAACRQQLQQQQAAALGQQQQVQVLMRHNTAPGTPAAAQPQQQQQLQQPGPATSPVLPGAEAEAGAAAGAAGLEHAAAAAEAAGCPTAERGAPEGGPSPLPPPCPPPIGTCSQAPSRTNPELKPSKALPSMPAPIPDNFQVTPGGVIFQHAVMNLPATAVQFLDAFRGALDPQRWEGSPLPMVHVYTFKTAAETDADILAKVELHLGGPLDSAPEVVNVRDVAPNKLMLCVSFQLPAAVAFMGRQALQQAVDGAAGDTATKRQKLEG
ncbi:hypothetical protein QJQ45_024270, partial [Haematococcus lacustris]